MFPGSNKDDRECDVFLVFFENDVGGLAEGSEQQGAFGSSSTAQIKILKERPVCLPSLPFKKGSFAKEFCEMSCLFISG